MDKITDYGDLMIYIKKKTNGMLDLSWDDVANLSRSTQQELMDILPTILDETCDSFAKPLALVDSAIDSQDFLNQLTDSIAEICALQAGLDGDTTRGESLAARKMTVDLLVHRWRKYMD